MISCKFSILCTDDGIKSEKLLLNIIFKPLVFDLPIIPIICNILYGRVATYYNKLKKTISKLHKSSSSVAFIKKALHNNITPTFAKIKGQFLNTNTKSNAEKDLMRGHINKHYNDIRLLRLDYCELKEQLQLLVGNTFTSILLKSIKKSLHKERLESFRTKNKKKILLI